MARVGNSIAPEQIGTWDIDPAHSTIEAVARFAMLSSVRGRFGTFSGTITVGQTLESSRVEVEIDAATIDTGTQRRDDHLRSEDFLWVEKHPNMTFISTRIEPGTGEGRYRVWGDLTMRGETREVELDMTFEGIGPDPWGNTRAGLEATTTLNRKDWGVNWNALIEAGGVLVSDTLNVNIFVSAIRRKEDEGRGESG